MLSGVELQVYVSAVSLSAVDVLSSSEDNVGGDQDSASFDDLSWKLSVFCKQDSNIFVELVAILFLLDFGETSFLEQRFRMGVG